MVIVREGRSKIAVVLRAGHVWAVLLNQGLDLAGTVKPTPNVLWLIPFPWTGLRKVKQVGFVPILPSVEPVRTDSLAGCRNVIEQ